MHKPVQYLVFTGGKFTEKRIDLTSGFMVQVAFLGRSSQKAREVTAQLLLYFVKIVVLLFLSLIREVQMSGLISIISMVVGVAGISQMK